LVSHVRVQPAMEMLIESGDCSVDGFLAAGHVCAVAGYESYHEFAEKYRRPVVVTGFEPVDLLTGILQCVRQLERGEFAISNCYPRSVAAAGNREAMALVHQVYEICDRPWRGFGIVPRGGFRLRDKWRRFDATLRFDSTQLPILEYGECRSGEVLAGRIKPTACTAFGTRCTPEAPLGAPMVSAEGACAAYFRYAALRSASFAENAHA
jgi:hydrogenase expression/formation protein HypD